MEGGAVSYADFVRAKSQIGGFHGFDPSYMPDMLFDYQKYLVEWATRKGRAAIFADCGMGKTFMQLAWAQNIVEREAKPVLILAPLMVSVQTVEEAGVLGVEASRKMGSDIVVTNYERLHQFDPDDFAGVVCDESSILKNFDGATKSAVTEFKRRQKFRLLCSATPSPNDYTELGTSSEALGYLGYMDMLSMFFKNDEDSLHPMSMGSAWRFKSHAENDFWRWLVSWARAVRKPSDLGFDDGAMILPELNERTVTLESGALAGSLFAMPARNLQEEREERRASINQRCEAAAEMLSARERGVGWCHFNAEGDLLEKLIPGAKQISGADCDERKEEIFLAFKSGQVNHVVTKGKIAAYGVNWQHCDFMTTFADHSYEQYYQMVRRFWRYGQKNPVTAITVTTENLSGMTRNRETKNLKAERMFAKIVANMADEMVIDRFKEHTAKQEIPAWL
jgi:hypothetical protein